MTQNTIKLSDSIGPNLILRTKAHDLGKPQKPNLDFCGVEMISRAFIDELYETIGEFSYINASEEIEHLLRAVSQTRENKSRRKFQDAQVIDCPDMESLNELLSTF